MAFVQPRKSVSTSSRCFLQDVKMHVHSVRTNKLTIRHRCVCLVHGCPMIWNSSYQLLPVVGRTSGELSVRQQGHHTHATVCAQLMSMLVTYGPLPSFVLPPSTNMHRFGWLEIHKGTCETVEFLVNSSRKRTKNA